MRDGPPKPFEIYLYHVAAEPTPDPRRARRRPTREALRRERELAGRRFRRRAREFLTQAGELRKLAALLAEPECLESDTAARFFPSLVPRLHSLFQIAESFRDSLRKRRVPAGTAGLDFLLRVAKHLVRQVQAALAVAELERRRCRRRPARFDWHRLLEETFRHSQRHYLGSQVGVTLQRHVPLYVWGKRPLWRLALLDVVCRAHEISPRRGVAARSEPAGSVVVLSLVPRGALVPRSEMDLRQERHRLLGRGRPHVDPAFLVTRRLVELLGGRLTVGRPHRSFVTPLFTVEIPVNCRDAASRA